MIGFALFTSALMVVRSTVSAPRGCRRRFLVGIGHFGKVDEAVLGELRMEREPVDRVLDVENEFFSGSFESASKTKIFPCVRRCPGLRPGTAAISSASSNFNFG